MEGKEVTLTSSGEVLVNGQQGLDNNNSGSSFAPAPPPGGAENVEQFNGSTMSAASVEVPSSAEGRKRRGRPRKYGPDGKVASFALSPMPISASIPLSGKITAWKRGRGRSVDSFPKPVLNKFEFESSGMLGEQGRRDRHPKGEQVAYPVGANFTPHVMTVNAGEDVSNKIISFSQQGSCSICVLSANGVISNVTLRQPNTSGGTLTYEGRFEILSLTGSFMPTEIGGMKNRSGGMSITLAGPDGRVLGGGLAGLLVAAGPVQVVVGTFIQGQQMEQKKKQRMETSSVIIPTISYPISGEGAQGGFGGGLNPIITYPSVPGNNSITLESSKTTFPQEEKIVQSTEAFQ